MWSRWETWLHSWQLRLSTSRHQEGQGLVEYAMILILAVLLVVVLLGFFAPWLNNVYLNIIGVL